MTGTLESLNVPTSRSIPDPGIHKPQKTTNKPPGLIPKPATIATALHTGSQSLYKQMNLSFDDFCDFRAIVHHSAEHHLDFSKSFKRQGADDLADHCSEVTRRWDSAHKYEDAWPINAYTTYWVREHRKSMQKPHTKKRKRATAAYYLSSKKSTSSSFSRGQHPTEHDDERGIKPSLRSGSMYVGKNPREIKERRNIHRDIDPGTHETHETSQMFTASASTAKSMSSRGSASATRSQSWAPAHPPAPVQRTLSRNKAAAAADPFAPVLSFLCTLTPSLAHLAETLRELGVRDEVRLRALAGMADCNEWLREHVKTDRLEEGVLRNGLKELAADTESRNGGL